MEHSSFVSVSHIASCFSAFGTVSPQRRPQQLSRAPGFNRSCGVAGYFNSRLGLTSAVLATLISSAQRQGQRHVAGVVTGYGISCGLHLGQSRNRDHAIRCSLKAHIGAAGWDRYGPDRTHVPSLRNSWPAAPCFLVPRRSTLGFPARLRTGRRFWLTKMSYPRPPFRPRNLVGRRSAAVLYV